MKIIAAAALALALQAAAQTPKPEAAKPPTAPVITDAQKAAFFKAQSFTVQANAQADKAKANYQAAIDAMQKSCGTVSTLESDQNGDPVCVLNPPATGKK